LPLHTNHWRDDAGGNVFPHGLISKRLSPTGTVMKADGKITILRFTNTGRVSWGWSLKPLVLASYWMLTLPAVALCICGATPFLGRRFSLRTLLIGMTVLAALLGLMIRAASN
jgi:hypothetical protein